MPDETSNVCWKKIRRNIGTETTIDVRCERTPSPQSPSCLVATVVDRICKPPSSNRSTNYSSNREIIKEVSPEDSVLLLRPTPENGFVFSFSLSVSLSIQYRVFLPRSGIGEGDDKRDVAASESSRDSVWDNRASPLFNFTPSQATWPRALASRRCCYGVASVKRCRRIRSIVIE